MTTTPFDLLREKRAELGLPEPAVASQRSRQSLVRGLAIGSVLLGVSLGVWLLLLLRSAMVQSQLEQLATVEAEVEQFQARLSRERSTLRQWQGVNTDLVQGLVKVRSGSALMRDLQLRAPQGVQFTELQEVARGVDQPSRLTLKGLASDPQPFARINALQLDLRRSPLVDPQGVRLNKAGREEARNQQANQPAVLQPVAFELGVDLRPPLAPAAERLILEQLGATGMARRLTLLQKEGLLP
jgi:type IV pilus assembly protein PilN